MDKPEFRLSCEAVVLVNTLWKGHPVEPCIFRPALTDAVLAARRGAARHTAIQWGLPVIFQALFSPPGHISNLELRPCPQ